MAEAPRITVEELKRRMEAGEDFTPPAVAVLQRLGPAAAIPRPHPFPLPITQLQPLRRFPQSHAARLHPPHHFSTTQFLRAQARSPQSECLLSEPL